MRSTGKKLELQEHIPHKTITTLIIYVSCTSQYQVRAHRAMIFIKALYRALSLLFLLKQQRNGRPAFQSIYSAQKSRIQHRLTFLPLVPVLHPITNPPHQWTIPICPSARTSVIDRQAVQWCPPEPTSQPHHHQNFTSQTSTDDPTAENLLVGGGRYTSTLHQCRVGW